MGSNSDLALAICETIESTRLPPDPRGTTTARTTATTNGRTTRNTHPPTLGRSPRPKSSPSGSRILNYYSRLTQKSTALYRNPPDTTNTTQHNLRQADFRQETGTQTVRLNLPIPIDAVSLDSFLKYQTQSGGTTSGPARLVREDQKVVSRKRAPCGSATSTMRPNVKSKGSTMTVPPSSRTRRAAASASSTPK